MLLSWSKYQNQKYTEKIPNSANLAVVCGVTSDNLVTIDVDSAEIVKEFEDFISKTLVVKTSSGIHIYLKSKYKLPKTLRLENKKKQHIDIQSQGTYVVAPTSIHPNGHEYVVISSTNSIMQFDFNEIFQKLQKLGFEIKKQPINKIIRGQIKEGNRHSSALHYANHLLFKTKLDQKTMQYEMERWNNTNNPPLSKDELFRIINDAIQYHDAQQNNTVEKDSTITNLSLDEYHKTISKEFTILKQTIEKNFVNRSFAIEVLLSVKAQMKVEGITQPFTLILMGNPSTHKSTMLEIVSTLPDCYVSDSFTPKSFVSHSANAKKSDLGKIDLLPRIKHKTLITPELAPLFSGKQDELIEYFGMLTRILDGRGFQSDSGVHGKRGYSGDYYFSWLGAVIDIPHRVWSLLGNLGPKIYFFRLPEDPITGDSKIKQIKKSLKENSYVQRLETSKIAIKKFWRFVESRPQLQDGKIIWNSEKDDEETLERIVELAMVLANLRGTIPTWYTNDSGGTMYNFETPIKEDPSRASSAFYNLARGHAVLYGRNYITKDDLSVVIPTALSSAPRERVDLFRLLIENEGKLNTERFMKYAKVSRATALKEMEKIHILGLVTKQEEEFTTKPIMTVKLRNEFDWFLTNEFKQYWMNFRKLLTPSNSKLSSEPKENLEKKSVCDIDSFLTEDNNSKEVNANED